MNEQVLIIILAIALHIIIDKLSDNYICPDYCKVEHKHNFKQIGE